LGLCAIAVPNGFTTTGLPLPLSLQIVCRAREEALALQIASAYQDASDWHHRAAVVT
jgi:aspartyl-tRNA(Asn)/glutamyl-tRNA(Gln) amidotransferase subunit A